MLMNGNFYDQQNLKDNDETVDAKGWVEWGPDDASVDLTITVSQNGYDCDGPSFTCTRNGTDQRSDWQSDVRRPAPPPWARGGASGHAKATVTKYDGTTYRAPWDNRAIQLK